ncbi:hypothetical protein ECEC1848_5519, partial [Escherichia coli EC1848]
MRLGRGG